MDLFKVIKERRTIRKFLNKDIPDKEIKKIIAAANYAPSACNVQGWRFIIFRSKKIKKKVVDAGAASFISDAPVGILVLYDNRTDNIAYRDDIQSAAAAIENMILTAWSMGVGCCWICHLPLKSQLRKIFEIPRVYDPIAYIAMGYPKKGPSSRPRKLPIEKIVAYDKFSFEVPSQSLIGLSLKRFCRRAYYLFPFRRHIKPAVDRIFERKFE